MTFRSETRRHVHASRLLLSSVNPERVAKVGHQSVSVQAVQCCFKVARELQFSTSLSYYGA